VLITGSAGFVGFHTSLAFEIRAGACSAWTTSTTTTPRP
jgi:nucleoside-diphosphate-sugar epimerase